MGEIAHCVIADRAVEVEKSLKLGSTVAPTAPQLGNTSSSSGNVAGGGNGGESSTVNSHGTISDYGLWPHGTAAAPSAAAAATAHAAAAATAAFPFPYSFFWPSKRPPPPFTPFHTSLLGN